MNSSQPLVGISCDTKLDGPHLYHLAGHKYINAVSESANALPVLLPSLQDNVDWDAMLDQMDGILLTGSYSNIQPHLYGLHNEDAGSHIDVARDATTLPLIKKIVEKGIPLLAICRGFQEINVAYGGTLHRMVHEVAGLDDHRDDKSLSLDEQYAPSHSIELVKDGLMSKMMAGDNTQMVNSIHMQGLDRLGNGLITEASAKDGLVEAFRIANSHAFTLAVQWHPEWKTPTNHFYTQIFSAFSDACKTRRQQRTL